MRSEKIEKLYRSLPKLYPWFIGAICVYLGLRMRAWMNLAFHSETALFVALALYLVFRVITDHSEANLVARSRVRTYLVG